MKKLVLLLLLAGWGLMSHAQSGDDIVIKASNKITRQATPKQVIDSLKKRFPNASAVQYYKTSADAVNSGWVVEEEDNLQPGDELDMYTIRFKRADFTYYALFEADGTLVLSKYEEYGSKLPDPVKVSVKELLGDDYKNYSLVSKNHYRSVNHEKKKDYYEVKVVSRKNKNDKKTIILAPDGSLIREKG